MATIAIKDLMDKVDFLQTIDSRIKVRLDEYVKGTVTMTDIADGDVIGEYASDLKFVVDHEGDVQIGGFYWMPMLSIKTKIID